MIFPCLWLQVPACVFLADYVYACRAVPIGRTSNIEFTNWQLADIHKTFKSIDFWNLAGRAGRLAKELQGNVFCVKHDERDWDKFDFLHERETQLVPAVFERITHNLQKKKLSNDKISQVLR